MNKYSLYGINGTPLCQVAVFLGDLLQVDFQERESSYKGGKYFLAQTREELEVSVESNWVDDEGYASEPEHANYEILVYVNRANEAVFKSISGVEGLKLLRVEEL